MQKILVSACLLGDPVRYDGRSKAIIDSELDELIKQDRLISICPEVAGGLPVPRDAAEIQQGDGSSVIDGKSRVKTSPGEDLTKVFIRGAELALDLCQKHQIRVAILTESSPSCGSNRIYDGSFSHSSRDGIGVTTALLRRHGISVFNQNQIADAIKSLTKAQAESGNR